MTPCPVCQSEVPNDRQICPACNSSLDSALSPTLVQADTPVRQDRAKNSSGSASFTSSHSIDDAKFIPGNIIADRYRIRGLLGKGGMGEVYRADDLKLSQSVALKFLPDFLATDGAALARFHREARIARQISHPNVCRVFDIGEVDGQQFISMEFVDGEDLASLLRRIGRLPSDKAVEIARQICAGVAAAHDTGVLHRDLKPANIMIDGRGKARITDFGLAAVAAEIGSDELRAGTPAYMAPEQISGLEVTPRSDVYSLGLVLYELFTGKRAFEGPTLNDLIDQQTNKTPASLTSIVKDIDPLIEKVIFRCLEKDPRKRPTSALQIAAALPGGDPLAAALAAGETPSPEMVAAAHVEGSLKPSIAVALLAVVLLGVVANIYLSSQTELYRMVPLDKSPDVLADRARTIVEKLGYGATPAERTFGFDADFGFIRYIRRTESSVTRWDRLRLGQPAALLFSYRQGQSSLAPSDYWHISLTDPPLLEPGMVNLQLDTRGRLTNFTTVPPAANAVKAPAVIPNWTELFNEAGLDIAKFTTSDPKWVPPVYSDARAAWDGVYPDAPDIPLHVEVSSYLGKPVYFEAKGPWREAISPGGNGASVSQKLFFVVILGASIGSIVLARKNLRLGRGDREGASRLFFCILLFYCLLWIFEANHLPKSVEMRGFIPVAWAMPIMWGLYYAVTMWLAYIALEPYLRQHWPQRIIAWSRLLSGGFRDPLVGRDILIGAFFGIILNTANYARLLFPKWIGQAGSGPSTINFGALLGARRFLGLFFDTLLGAIVSGLMILFLLLLLYILLRKEWAAIVVLGAILTVLNVLGYSSHNLPDWIGAGIDLGASLFVLRRFGLLAVVSWGLFDVCFQYPYTSDFNAWYAGSMELALFLLSGIAVYGFYTSLAGQRVFRSS